MILAASLVGVMPGEYTAGIKETEYKAGIFYNFHRLQKVSRNCSLTRFSWPGFPRSASYRVEYG